MLKKLLAHICDVTYYIVSNKRRKIRQSCKLCRILRMEHPPRARLKYGAADGRRAWIEVIPRGSTVLVTEGHINLIAVSVFEVRFPPASCIADGQRHRREEMGTASRGGHALGHLRDDTTVGYMGCTWFLGTRTNASF